ncbi:hypothetical protein V7S43_017081 [Phytophthora oleae]|uniref:Uncharacterized protein n=1 Tax=Phytophthora oleae TaxID=2107226 RepID=A0ABD3EYK1_9STRA
MPGFFYEGRAGPHPGLDNRYRYIKLGGDPKGVEGVDVLLREEAVLRFVAPDAFFDTTASGVDDVSSNHQGHDSAEGRGCGRGRGRSSAGEHGNGRKVGNAEADPAGAEVAVLFAMARPKPSATLTAICKDVQWVEPVVVVVVEAVEVLKNLTMDARTSTWTQMQPVLPPPMRLVTAVHKVRVEYLSDVCEKLWLTNV